MPGTDYRDFYDASVHVLAGESPYLTERYVTPPLFSVVNAPLAMLGFERARFIFLSLIPLTILVSYVLIYRSLKPPGAPHDLVQLTGGLFIFLFSYPFYFLFERGNIDGIVLLCMCLGLYLESRRQWQSGLLLSLAMLFKIYPILLMAWLFVTRRWKVLVWVCAWVLLFSLLTAPYWESYLARFTDRVKESKFEENGSLVNTSLFLYGLLDHHVLGQIVAKEHISAPVWRFAQVFSLSLWAAMCAVVIFTDYKLHRFSQDSQKIVSALMYFPFMVAFPRTVFHYGFIILIVLLPGLDHLWSTVSSRSKRYTLILISLGIALSQWQAVALSDVAKNIIPSYIPGIGLLLCMIGISVYKLLELKEVYSVPSVSSLEYLQGTKAGELGEVGKSLS
ncbi:MAG: glycosyltransferase family 87 protein [Anaerolineales bacterium]